MITPYLLKVRTSPGIHHIKLGPFFLSLAAKSSVFQTFIIPDLLYTFPLKWHIEGTLDKVICNIYLLKVLSG